MVATLVRFVLDAALMLAALFLSYRLLHRGLGVRPIERLIVLTSLTHFAFWRRYRLPRDLRAGTLESEPREELKVHA